MREAELAALSDEFFEPEFSLDSAVVMLGSPVGSEELGEGRTATYLRPDARALARVEVIAGPARASWFDAHDEDDGPPVERPFVESVLLVLRGTRSYSLATLEELLGPSRRLRGPDGDEGEVSWQLEFDQVRAMAGMIVVRWWGASDEHGHDVDAGPDAVRADEIELRRTLPFAETLPSSHAEETTSPASDAAPAVRLGRAELDEAMDAGAWIADLAWKILRPDFTVERAQELLGQAADDLGSGRVLLRPHDPRLASVSLVLRAGQVASVQLGLHAEAPLRLAIDAVADRLNAPAVPATRSLRFQFEATRSRGIVTLWLVDGSRAAGPIAAVHGVDIARG